MAITKHSQQKHNRAPQTSCFHCGEPIGSQPVYTSVINGTKQPMCCAGCKAVADLITSSGMSDFYTKRTHYADTPPQQLLESDFEDLDFESSVEEEEDGARPAERKKVQLLIGGMTCAACSWLVERQVKKHPGVKAARASLSESTLNLDVDSQTPIASLMRSVAELGYRVQPFKASERTKLLARENNQMLKRLAVAGLGMMQVGMFAIALHAGSIQGMEQEYRQLMRWVSLPIALFVTLYSGAGFFRSAWSHLKAGAIVMDFPISLALSLALGSSIYATITASGEVYFDSVVMFVFFLLTARYFEHRSRYTNSLLLQKIQDTLPLMVTRIAEHEAKLCSLKDVELGDRLRIFVGATIPLDGRIIQGTSEIDESAFTGESVPRHVVPEATVFAGTINTKQTIDIEVNTLPTTTKLAALEDAISFAETQKPKIAQLADRIAGRFILFVLLTSAITGVIWWQYQPHNAFWIALSVLVVSCPCALGLATPAALTAAAQKLRRMGAIIRGDSGIEQLSHIDTIIFDKTGTLTDGNFRCSDVRTIDIFSQQDCFDLACALQAHSDHPVASAFNGKATRLDQPEHPFNDVINALYRQDDEVPESVLNGLTLSYSGHNYLLGNRKLLEHCEASLSWPETDLHWIGLAIDGTVVAFFGLQDRPRAGAHEAVSHYYNADIKTILLTGDASAHARSFARNFPFTETHFGLTPQEKLGYLAEQQHRGATVAMVGDGINDAAALAQASVGIAVAQATDLARAKSDIVVTNFDLQPLTQAHKLALKTRRIIRQNLAWALSYNIVAIPLACMGHVPPWLAALGMSFSSLVVVFNSLRLQRTNTL